MLLNLHSSLTFCHPNIGHLFQLALRAGVTTTSFKACAVPTFPCRHHSKVSQGSVSPVCDNPLTSPTSCGGLTLTHPTITYGKRKFNQRHPIGHLRQMEVIYYVWALFVPTASAGPRSWAQNH